MVFNIRKGDIKGKIINENVKKDNMLRMKKHGTAKKNQTINKPATAPAQPK